MQAQGGFPLRADLRALAGAALAAAVVAVVALAAGAGGGVPAVPPEVSSAPSGGERATASANDAYAKLPLAFEPNRGQSDERVRFLARGAGYGLFLTAGEAVLSLTPTQAGSDASGLLGGGSPDAVGGMSMFGGMSDAKRGAVLRFGLLGANPNAKIAGAERLPSQSNYMLGADPRRWQTGIPNYAKVRYSSVYPGTDLVYYGRQGQLEYDFVLAPGADPGRIAFSVAGAQRVTIDGRGDLVLSTAGGEVIQRRPVVYQQIGSQRRKVAGHYRLKGNDRVGFEIGGYDRSRPLVIDPVIAYSSHLGGSANDYGNGIAVDASGTYLTGSTTSTNFPTQAPAQTASGGSNEAYVSKFNAAGNALVYSTYLGGGSNDSASAIAVDGSGNAYVTGGTSSVDFPTAPKPPAVGAPIQPAQGTPTISDAFVAKLTATGALAYSTYLGGAGIDGGSGIAVDSAGSAYVTGTTSGFSSVPSNFPTKNALQPAAKLGEEAFVSKLTFTGMPANDLVYSTFLGGANTDHGFDIAVDAGRAAYVTGRTYSTDFPTANALQPAPRGSSEAFVSKINAGGSALAYSTFLGGSSDDVGWGIAVDAAGSAYVTGQAWSTDFPTASPFQPASKINGDAFVSKYNAAGSAFIASTYLGGSDQDIGYDIAVDSTGSAHVTGETRSTDFPTRIPVQAAKGASADAFVSKLSGSTLSSLASSTYLGGNSSDTARDIAVDVAGNTYAAGDTSSTNFPTASAYQPARAGTSGSDAFVTKLIPGADVSVSKTDAPDPVVAGQPLTYTLNVANAGPDVSKAVSVSDQLPAGVTLLSTSQGCTQASGKVSCGVGDLATGASAQHAITVRPDSANPALANTATVQSQTFDPVAANNSATATTDVRAPAPGLADVSVIKSDSPDPLASGGELTYTLRASNAGPDRAEAVSLGDQLPAGVAFVSAPPGCSYEAPTRIVRCDLGDLDRDVSDQREIAVRTTAPNPALSNTATVASSTADPLSSNNADIETTTVRAVADVSILNRDFPDPVVAGRELTYTLTAKNTGPDVAPGVVISDALPEGVQFVSASGCSLSDAVVSCSVGDLAGGGATAQRKIVVRPTEANPALSNTASVQSAAVDSDSSNNSLTATTVVREAPTPPPPDGGTTPPPGDPGGSMGATPLAPSGPLAPSAPLLPSAPRALVAVSDQSISPRRFAAAPSGPSALAAQQNRARGKSRRPGARVSYRLNMAASVRFTISHSVRGRLQGSGKSARCVAQTSRNRTARACRRTVTLPARFILSGEAGQNSFTFTGRLANRKLQPGSYTLTATPTANGKTGKPASLSFMIITPR